MQDYGRLVAIFVTHDEGASLLVELPGKVHYAEKRVPQVSGQQALQLLHPAWHSLLPLGNDYVRMCVLVRVRVYLWLGVCTCACACVHVCLSALLCVVVCVCVCVCLSLSLSLSLCLCVSVCVCYPKFDGNQLVIHRSLLPADQC